MFSMYCFLGIINVDFMTSYALETAPSHLDCTGAVQWQATHAGVRDPASVCALLTCQATLHTRVQTALRSPSGSIVARAIATDRNAFAAIARDQAPDFERSFLRTLAFAPHHGNGSGDA